MRPSLFISTDKSPLVSIEEIISFVDKAIASNKKIKEIIALINLPVEERIDSINEVVVSM
ncbi:hypothetical protein [Mucilaginibacter pocheonensis]|uniref:Uncharacterized protein n=1 Tax=Mucilaginibacter pocheonensis TaxID=398050 RepID=A0ABU1T6I9_9SPHI|nr:hypothetical protein [Mucilaginibacter pocheonensis]MDR6940841.1 hypothetical protein [Mucilaginibacter pocheonensis]